VRGVGTMIPDAIRRFVLTSVPSIPYLEAALLLRRDEAATWDASSVAKALYVTPPRAAELLRELAGAGVAAFDPERQTYRYAPRDDTLAAMLVQLAGLYRSDTIAVTQLVHDTTQRSAYRFANAFNIRKDDGCTS
jgi:Mn-dependent DtxR family transcriptional regulator